MRQASDCCTNGNGLSELLSARCALNAASPRQCSPQVLLPSRLSRAAGLARAHLELDCTFPMGLSLRSRLILLGSHRMKLTKELMNPSQIVRDIEIFSESIFAYWSPRWSQGFESSISKSGDHDDRLTVMKPLVVLGGFTV